MGWGALIWVGAGILLMAGSGSAVGFAVGLGMEALFYGYLNSVDEKNEADRRTTRQNEKVDPRLVMAEAQNAKLKLIQDYSEMANYEIGKGNMDMAHYFINKIKSIESGDPEDEAEGETIVETITTTTTGVV